jgi:hypothetical protein
VKVVNKAFCGLNFDIVGCFFSIESVLYDGPPGGGIDIILSLVLKGGRGGELDDFDGDCLLAPACGGLKTIFLLDAAFFIGRSGDDFLGFEFCADGIGA